MAILAQVLRQIKDDLAHLLSQDLITGVCAQIGYRWRERLLDPVTTIHLFILQVLHGNTACTHLPHLAQERFTASAYCQARSRLPLAVLQALVAKTGQAMSPSADGVERWHGHRTYLVDGSGCSMPDTPELQDHFGQPGGQRPGCGFPVAHLLVLFGAVSGLIQGLIVSPLRTHDMAHIQQIHPHLEENDLLVGDRGFCSFVHLALLLAQKCHGLFRMHQRQIVDFRPHRRCARKNDTGRPRGSWLKRLGVHDQVVEWLKPQQRPKWMTAEAFAALPESIMVRELRYAIRTPGFRTREVTLVTTLLDPHIYPAEEWAELYRQRWQVEVNLRHLKQTMGMDVLHCKSVDGVMKELWVFVLVYNLVRMVMLEAARRQQVAPERISFIDALRWLCHAHPGEQLPALMLNPHRPNRIEPRVAKRRPRKYKLMKQPRPILRKALKIQKDVA